MPGCRAAQNYHDLFVEFLNRFSDKSVEVRVTALQCVKDFCTANPTGAELHEVLCKLCSNLTCSFAVALVLDFVVFPTLRISYIDNTLGSCT